LQKTKSLLDARKKNSAMPGKVVVNEGEETVVKKNAVQEAAEFFKAQGRTPLAAAKN